MFKEFIKIQFIALLILVLNAMASQNIKLIPKEKRDIANVAKVKTLKKINKKEKEKINFPTITATSPRGILLRAIEKSLN